MPTSTRVFGSSRHFFAPAAAAVLAGAAVGAGGAPADEIGQLSARAAIPLLAPWSPPSAERDMPPAVRARLEREQRALFDQARAAARLPVTAANGCESSSSASTPGSLGPPAPVVSQRILGHHVEVVFDYPHMPPSPACRPWGLTAVVYSGGKGGSTFKNSVGQYRIRGRRGRVVVDLPWYARPPYHVIVGSTTITGRRGPQVERTLRCPITGDLVDGCLAGYRPGLHTYPMPKPVLPIRGIDRATLEASLRYVLADERTPPILLAVPRASRCASLNRCEVTYADPAFPASPYRVRYRIAGQQVRGCWMGMREVVIDPMPYEDAGRGRLELAACASWLG
jgi:hypothetical protein